MRVAETCFKFRLKHCGLKRPIYLVESHGSMKNLSLSEDALQQAISNTQIIDQLYVKRTADVRESAAYLTVITRRLQAAFAVVKSPNFKSFHLFLYHPTLRTVNAVLLRGQNL